MQEGLLLPPKVHQDQANDSSRHGHARNHFASLHRAHGENSQSSASMRLPTPWLPVILKPDFLTLPHLLRSGAPNAEPADRV